MTPEQHAVMAEAERVTRDALSHRVTWEHPLKVGDTFDIYGRTVRAATVNDTTVGIVVEPLP